MDSVHLPQCANHTMYKIGKWMFVDLDRPNKVFDLTDITFQVSTTRWIGGMAKKFTVQKLGGSTTVRFVPVPS